GPEPLGRLEEPVLRLLSARQVETGADPAGHLPVGVAQRRCEALDPRDAAVRPAEAILDDRGTAVLPGLPPLRPNALAVVRVQRAHPAVAERLLRRQPGQLAPALIDELAAAVGVGDEDPDGCVRRQRAEELLVRA